MFYQNVCSVSIMEDAVYSGVVVEKAPTHSVVPVIERDGY